MCYAVTKGTRKIRIALPDGNGVYGSREFWAELFGKIGVEYVDTEEDILEEYVRTSNEIFPRQICTNSKYRLGRALALADKVDYFMFFLREDNISNCLASIYRIEWIKDYFTDVKTIVWKRDLCPGESDVANFIKLSEILTGKSNKELLEGISIPKRKVIYDMSLRNIKKDKKTLMLIGVAPFFVDLYRKSDLMDYIVSKVNLLNPTSIASPDIAEVDYKLYKENTILNSIDKVIKHDLVDGYLFVGDPFDLPGKYTFPKFIKYIRENTDKRILELSVGTGNQDIFIKQFDEFVENL